MRDKITEMCPLECVRHLHANWRLIVKACGLGLLLQFAGIAQVMTGNGSISGVSFSYETRLEPPAPIVTRSGGGTLTENDIAKRHICDFARQTYFGYDLRMEPLPNGQYRVTFSPLTITPSKMQEIFPEVKNWTLLPLPKQPATQVVKTGDTIALDLFVNPSTGQKLVEYLIVQGGQGRALSAYGPARDFSVEESILRISAPKLSINGKPQEATHGFRGAIGSPIWIHIGGRGRFIFTLLPRLDLGFQKAGEIRGSTMAWRWGADEFSLNTDSRIAPGEGAYNLYVFHDPNYSPLKSEELTMGAGGKLESLVRRQ